ncbi:ATP-binding cassette domain-containing protein [bacterium]|jgi:Fe-S cluster assembly ATP-binding protein|nr:ATP-binding cassette domain-containing protein [bacterium]|tara:strand:- start:307 stop:1026 length:720 start_codon:yes stop_codon:yes gene_type:complete
MLVTQEFSIKVDGYYPLLNDMHLEYGPGVHIIMGPNGVGKSTFAHALMGSPNLETEGAVEFNGKDLLAMETYERARAGLFVSFQSPTPIEGLSNFQFMRQALNSLSTTDKLGTSLKKFKGLSAELGLSDEWDKKQLNVQASGGEKKKNELIQLEMLNPQTAILDEPDSGLDIDAIKVLTRKLTDFANKEGKTLIIISHYAELITNLNPDTVTVFNKEGYAKQYDDVQVAYDILENGFNG